MLGNIFILGDSYSTFDGYVPEGYAVYYDSESPNYVKKNDDLELTDNDVRDVTHTWWYNLANENGTLLKNCSWSGTTICNTGYNGADNSDKSFIARLEKLIDSGYFEQNKVDTFFLFGGTNDSWSGAPLGEPIYSGWTKENLYCALPAFSYLIELICKKLPEVKTYCIMNCNLKEEITDFYKTTCRKYDMDFIELHDIDKVHGHPTIKGMASIKQQVLDYITTHK